MENLTKKPLNEIIIEMSILEKKIDLYIYKYNLLNEEVCRRFPFLNEQEEFKPKILNKNNK